jgi:CelD/BcsL family acetyltransferase involved in cellulose biosynthesis
MTWTTTEHPAFLDGELRAAWRRLAAAAPHPQTADWWVEAWLAQFAPAGSRLLVWRCGDEVRALLPLIERRERDAHSPLPHFSLTHAGDGFTDALPLLVAPGDEEALDRVAGWLDGRRSGHDEIRLCPLIEGSPAWPLAALLAERGWECQRVEGNPVLVLDGDFEALAARVGRNLRKDVGKKKRRLAEAGWRPELRLERACTPELLAELGALARLRHAAEGRRSVFLDPGRAAFAARAGRLAQERGEFACFAARHEGRLLAFRFGFLHGGSFFDWITSYDPALFEYSIGKLVLWDIVEALCALGVQRLDFMAGEEDYKLKWLPQVAGMHRLRVRRPSAANLVRGLLRTASRVRGRWIR